MLGTIVNALAILAGGGIGLLIRGISPERFRVTIMQGLALAVILIGVQGALKTDNVMCVISSLVIGGFVGEAIRIESRLEHLGDSAKDLFSRMSKDKGGEKTDNGSFSQGFLSASLVYCVGAMAIIGALEDGLTGSPNTLFAKAILDGISAIFFASTMGAGVLLAALPVFLYQGIITLLAHAISGMLTTAVMAEMSAVGGLLIVGIGLNLLNIVKINVGNLLPATLIPLAYIPVVNFITK